MLKQASSYGEVARQPSGEVRMSVRNEPEPDLCRPRPAC